MPPKKQKARSRRPFGGDQSSNQPVLVNSNGSHHDEHSHPQLQEQFSALLDSLIVSNDAMMEAIVQNKASISKLQGENAHLLRAAQQTRRILDLLKQEASARELQLQTALKNTQQLASEERQTDSQSARESQLQTALQNAQQSVAEERQTNEQLRAELKASQDLVVELLRGGGAAVEEAIEVIEDSSDDDETGGATAYPSASWNAGKIAAVAPAPQQQTKQHTKQHQTSEERKRQQTLQQQHQQQREAARLQQEQQAARLEKEEKERRLLIKKEKQDALARQQAEEEERRVHLAHTGEQKSLQSTIQEQKSDTSARKSRFSKETTMMNGVAKTGGSVKIKSLSSAATKRTSPARKMKIVDQLADTRLSRYLYPGPTDQELEDRKSIKERLKFVIQQKARMLLDEKALEELDGEAKEDYAEELENLNKEVIALSEQLKKTFVSPIFALLQDPTTLGQARQLLQYESDMADLKTDFRNLEKEKNKCKASIAYETKLGQDFEKELDEYEREASNIQGKFGSFNFKLSWWDKDSDDEEDESEDKTPEQLAKEGIRERRKKEEKEKARKMTTAQKAARMKEIRKEQERIQKSRDESAAKIVSLEAESLKLDEPINTKLQQISDLRTLIAELKGDDEPEDETFHIDGSRDEHGHTFLMVAAQNNDVDTARLCFLLGAHPNVRSPEGLTAIVFAQIFRFDEMATLIANNGGIYPKQQSDAWKAVVSARTNKTEKPIDWSVTLKIAEQAAIPPEKIFESAEALEESEDSRMAMLTREEGGRPFEFFEGSLIDSHFDPSSMRRVILLSKDSLRWFKESEASAKFDFLSFLNALKPEGIRAQQEANADFHFTRKAVIGLKKTYEVLCAPFRESSQSDVVLLTPFVTSPVDGVADIGVLVWVITTDDKASLFKTLIESAEFLRHKVDDDEHFPSHVKEVLELGKDVHLLDLNSTSIFTSKPLELYIVDIDKGDLGRLDYQDFAPQKRISYFEAQLNRTLFDSSEEEARDNEAILSGEQGGMSTSLFGGAGTGKTLLLTKKIISLPVERRILLVSRLPRLVSVIKGAVEQERDARNVTFSTYDDLLALLTRSVDFSSEEAEHHGFSPFSQVQFASATDTGTYSSVSFCDAFVEKFLEANERKVMKENQIEPITLWTAFRTIKARASCAMTKTALTRQEYIKLPPGFGLRQEQREVVYDMYLRYEEWLRHGNFKWDEADRVIHILKYGPSVYSDKEFLSWEKRVRERGELDLLDTDGRSPLSPFFYDMVFADEAQDFSELDLALLLRMSRGVRSLFLGADPAQSVELGIRMQKGTIKDVFHDHLPRNKNLQVKEVLQEIQMRTNHRTHAQNLAIATAVRRILARSFGVPESKEKALINGPIPEGLSLERLKDLANRKLFIGGDIVFLTPDEMLEALRADLHKLGIQNDVFGIREAKGLEFNAVALLGFFSYVDGLGNIREWENVLRWLSSSTGITTRQSSEKIQGRHLEDCDYGLSHPEILDQAMLLYTAITRARNHLYLIEVKELDRKRSKRSAGVDLDDFAFRRFKDLDLMKIVKSINEGYVEMTPAQHKARGVLLVTQAINLSRSPTTASTTVKERFLAAADRFRPDKGDDKELLDQCLKHMDAVLLKRSLIETVKRKFFVPLSGKYDLTGRFADILTLEQDCDRFFRLCIGDSFLADEMSDVRALMEDLFAGTPYEVRFGEICEAIRKHEV